MLPAKNRLKLTFKVPFKGRRLTSEEFIAVANKKKGVFKSAVVISKKVAAKAVDRNRIRRLVTESIRTNLGDIKFEGELIVIVKKNIANLKKHQVEQKVLELIAKL